MAIYRQFHVSRSIGALLGRESLLLHIDSLQRLRGCIDFRNTVIAHYFLPSKHAPFPIQKKKKKMLVKC